MDMGEFGQQDPEVTASEQNLSLMIDGHEPTSNTDCHMGTRGAFAEGMNRQNLRYKCAADSREALDFMDRCEFIGLGNAGVAEALDLLGVRQFSYPFDEVVQHSSKYGMRTS
eukprot:396704-Amphidinium_carterae.1